VSDRVNHNPDVLSCLANLSNDEVLTPPEVANAMLDMLPQGLFKDPNARFLDPACKSGIFLREIAKRLLEGLKDSFPDRQERIDHIFHKQLYGIAITEITSLLARRSLYCSKYANSIYSVTSFDGTTGNIRFKQIEHTWNGNGKCQYCGASKEQFDRGKEFESHAYEFIHGKNIKELYNMKFDLIISNPPYQISDGGYGDSAKPIYHLFVEQAKKLKPRYLSMIIPARWYSGGKGLNEFRKVMLNDARLSVIHDYPETKDCFPGVNIRGGVCYFLWDRDNKGLCEIYSHRSDAFDVITRPLLEVGADTFIRYNKAIQILRKVQEHNEPTMEQLVSSRKPFGIPTNFSDYEDKPTGLYKIKIFKNGGYAYVRLDSLTNREKYLGKYKVLVSKASPGSDDYPHLVFSEPIVAHPNEACTETYLVVSLVEDEEQGKHLKMYMATKFFRFLVLLIKNTQDVPKRVYSFVPQQNLDEEWDDEKLYLKYNISEDEQAFIHTLVKDVAWK